MKKVSKISGLLAVAVLASGFAISQGDVDAASKSSKSTKTNLSTTAKTAKIEGKGNLLGSAATLLGVTEAALHTELHATTGQSLAAIATAKKGWTQADFATKLVAAETARIDSLVTAGTITAAKATELKTNLSARVTYEITKVHAMKLDNGLKGPKGHMANPLASAATLLGITEEALHAKLHGTTGVSLAAVATELKGWTQADFAAKLVAAETARIDALVTAGTITAAKATELKTDLTAKITAQITKVHGAGDKAGKHAGEGKKSGKGGRGHK
ncbi:MAG: hypothetical protein RLZZ267_475 [Bacillota bacterium]